MSNVTMTRVMRLIAVILIVAGCRPSGSVSTGPLPPVRATFTTMGNMIVAPGRSTQCPAWFFERWTIAIASDGTTEIDVSNGQRSVLSRRTVISPRLHDEIARFLDAHLPTSPQTVGALATDSDYGSIELGDGRILSAEGALDVDERFAEFYKLVRYLERRLDIPDPWCRVRPGDDAVRVVPFREAYW